MTVLFQQAVGSEPTTSPSPKKRGGGARTPEGKEACKRNALKHGLRAQSVLTQDLAAAVAQRTTDFLAEFGPQTPYETWLVGEMALNTAKLDHCAEMMLVDLQRGIDRALVCWDLDRGVSIDDLGARLPKDPRRVARALERTKHGSDFLLEHWQGLCEVLQTKHGWDEPQRRLAFDLLGVPPELRDGSLKLPAEADAATLGALVDAEVKRLGDARENYLLGLDEAAQSMAACGMPLEEDATTARLRKYEARIRRGLSWAHAELRRVRAEAAGDGVPASGAAPASEPGEESERPYANGAGLDFLVRRSQLDTGFDPGASADEADALRSPAPAASPVTDPEPWVVSETLPDAAAADDGAFSSLLPSPSLRASLSSLPLSPPPRNRRERLSRAKKARHAARVGAQ